MMENDEQLIARFFADNKQDIADKGFTRKVMRQLPVPAQRLNRVWTAICSVAAVVFFFLFNGVAAVKNILIQLGGDLLGGFVSLEVGGVSPIFIYLGVLSAALVWAYNVVESPNQ